jgi:hypothetical protein
LYNTAYITIDVDFQGLPIFIYSFSAQLISFEIEICISKSIVFTACEHEYMNMGAPNYRSSGVLDTFFTGSQVLKYLCSDVAQRESKTGAM